MFHWKIADKENARLAVATAMSRHVGRGRAHDLDGLSEKTRIKRRTLQSYAQAQATPPYENLIKLMRELPEDFADEILRPAGLGGVSRLSSEDACDMKLLAIMNGASGEIATAYAEKGKVCHVRRPRIMQWLASAHRVIGASLRRHSEHVQ